PSAVRGGGRRCGGQRNAAAAALSGPVTTRTSPGTAPARPGTRADRPSAVRLTITAAAALVSPPTTGTPVSAIPSYSETTSSARVSGGTASETTRASGVAPEAARSL